MRARRAGLLVAALLGALAGPRASHAQAWAALDVPDSARVAAVRSLGARYEAAWNALFVDALRGGRTSALWPAVLSVAEAEPRATGGHVAPDALALAARWNALQKLSRVRAAEAESLAAARQGARDWSGAERAFEDALARYRRLGETRRTAWVLGSLGVVLFSSGRLAEAESVYTEALAARRALGDPRLVGNTLNALGSTNVRLGRFAAALPFLREARAVRMATGEQAALGATLNTLAAIAPSLGMPDSARGWYGEALALTSQAGDSARTAEVLTNLAGFERAYGVPSSALALLRRALAIIESRNDPAAEAVNRSATALLLADLGRYSDAAHEADRAAERARDAGDARLVAAALVNGARAWVLAEDPDRARAPLARAVSLADSLGDPGLVASTAQLAAQRARLDGDLAEAARGAERALGASVERGDSSLVRESSALAAQVAQARGRFAEAERAYRRALSISAGGSPADQVVDHLNLGQLLSSLGRTEEARRELERSRELASGEGARELAWMTELALGDAAERSGDREAALARYRRAAALADSVRRGQSAEASVAVFARRTLANGALVQLLVIAEQREPGHGHGAEAFEWSERAKARALLDLRARRDPAASLVPATLEGVRARLPDAHTAVLAYSVGDSGSVLWVVRRERTVIARLPARAALRARIEGVRRGWAAPGTPDARTRRLAHELARDVIAPALASLAGITRLVIVPDGPLWLLPLEALPSRSDRADDDTPWAERFAVSYLPAAALLGAAPRPGGARIVAVGDVSYGEAKVADGAALAPLPASALEVSALRQLAGGNAFTALTRDRATRAAVLAATAEPSRVLHLATHGDPREREPAHSGVWLAPGADGVPGRLEAADVLERGIAADHVTLSACGSGLGRLAEGEGVLGLTRAFLAAGSQSVLVSLWSVSDASTAELMRRFYDAALRRGLPRDRALAEARRALRREPATAAPFHWAPFVLVGEAGPLAR